MLRTTTNAGLRDSVRDQTHDAGTASNSFGYWASAGSSRPCRNRFFLLEIRKRSQHAFAVSLRSRAS